MEDKLSKKESIVDFFIKNRQPFSEELLQEAVNVKERIDEIYRIGEIDLLLNAHRLVLHVVKGEQHDLIEFANKEGVAWARHNLTVSFKLEWLQAIHRVLWRFLYKFDLEQKETMDRDRFFQLEETINDLLDQFLNQFFLSYSDYKERQLETQQQLIEHLTVPVIPLTDSISILPLIGGMDASRMKIIQEKLLEKISELKLSTVIIDFSGVSEMEQRTMEDVTRLLHGTKIIGCNVIITGLQPNIIREMKQYGGSFEGLAETKGTLQKALQEYLQ